MTYYETAADLPEWLPPQAIPEGEFIAGVVGLKLATSRNRPQLILTTDGLGIYENYAVGEHTQTISLTRLSSVQTNNLLGVCITHLEGNDVSERFWLRSTEGKQFVEKLREQLTRA